MTLLKTLRSAALLLAAWLLITAGSSALARNRRHDQHNHHYQYHHPTHYVHYQWYGRNYPYSTPPMQYRKGVNPFYSIRKPVPGYHN